MNTAPDKRKWYIYVMIDKCLQLYLRGIFFHSFSWIDLNKRSWHIKTTRSGPKAASVLNESNTDIPYQLDVYLTCCFFSMSALGNYRALGNYSALGNYRARSCISLALISPKNKRTNRSICCISPFKEPEAKGVGILSVGWIVRGFNFSKSQQQQQQYNV